MGLVNKGIPQTIVRELARLSRASVFVETGTFQGATARWAAGHFDQVHTIELARQLYDQHHAELASLDGVHPHFGDSAEILPGIVSKLTNVRALYWLDGHWSGGETAGEGNECPLMTELECLVDRDKDIILVDDARLFLCAPPKPHQAEQWPTIADIVNVFDRNGGHPRFFQIINDVIFIVPPETAIKAALIEYAQSHSEQSNAGTDRRGLRRLAGKLLRV